MLHVTVRGGIGCDRRWVHGGAGMTTAGVLLTRSIKSITCFGRALRMIGALAVLADRVFGGFCARFGAR